MTQTKVLITGITGLIGGIVHNRLRQFPDRYQTHGLGRTRHARRKGAQLGENHLDEIPDERFHLTDLADREAVETAMADIDVVVHLAAVPSSRAPWDVILHSNIEGTQHVFEAARQAGVQRVIFASTIQTVFGYWEEPPYLWIREGELDRLPDPLPLLSPKTPPRPTSYYACSKVFGEALGRMYAEEHGLSVLCLRIGGVPVDNRPRPVGRGHWCSHRDLAQLIQRGVDASPDIDYGLYYAVSDNRYRWLDLSNARQQLGYTPQDDAERWLDEE